MSGTIVKQKKDYSTLNSRLAYIGSLSILCVLILFGAKFHVLSYIAFVYASCLILLSNQLTSLSILLLISPMAEVFKPAPGTSSFFTYLSMLYVLKYLLKSKTFSLPIYVIFVYSLIISIQSFATQSIVKFLVSLLMISLSTELDDQESYPKLFWSCIAGVLVSSTAAFFLNEYIGFDQYISWKTEGLYLTHYSGLCSDPNYYAVSLIISLCLLLILYLKKKCGIVVVILLTLAMFYFVIVTYSKSAILMTALPVLLFFYINIKRKSYIVQAVGIAITVTILVYAFSGAFDILEPLFSRFDAVDDLDSLTTGRTAIWKMYAAFFIEHPFLTLFGSGVGAEFIQGRALHNTYMEILYHFGVIGGLIIVWYLSTIFKTHKNAKSVVNYSVLICIVAMYSFLSELFGYEMPCHVILAFMVFNYKTTIKEKTNNEK